jgi:hypothetical protein
MSAQLGGQPAYVTVISAGRPGSVPRMEAFAAGLDPRWYVPAEEMGEYSRAGARHVASSRDMNDARNRALDDAAGAWNVQLSDDLHRLQLMTPVGKRPVSLLAALGQLVSMCVRYGAHLGGAAPTDNAYFAKKRLSFDKFIVGDLLVMDSACPERFDPLAALKSDYDFTLQHLAAYGRVVRWDYLLASFDHKTNRGGCPAYRTEAIEQAAIAHLKAKWPGCIVDNARRANEVLLRWPAP